MSETATGSTVPRRELGRYLRKLRTDARMTVRAAALALEWSEAKMWRIETGHTSLRSLDVEAMCRIYGAPADMRKALMALARETKTKGWWHAYGDIIPDGFDLYMGLEEAAETLEQYSPELVPGLLQTSDYYRALLNRTRPELNADEIERKVLLRAQRQVLITRATAPPTLHLILNEAVLRRQVGGPDVMAAQLHRLAELNELPHVHIRVSPFEQGAHQGFNTGQFILLRFPTTGDGRDHEPPTVYVQGFTGALYLDKAHEIHRYAEAFAVMWDEALSEADSTALFQQIAREIKER
ncbi:helix-turn-helix domain-containing protein [Actinocorallia sp. API 0066]|uniref:helix-turn-helix domain-containing protein n=1 Tax=Actinocorallia sp. API 0066 TaxID=2896846 RepID=UPI001E5133B1|nr:helix-turn-helix transcriptional regulator [Actinocorallia sp. API 0066]MCD0453136.1 helix-turn-helix domain-containing protein [Actinocorallia sp. API 0066]